MVFLLFSFSFLCFLSFYFFFNPVAATHQAVSARGSQCLSGKGEGYRGRIAITESGNACQHWNTQFPHKHGWRPDRYPCKYAEPCHFNKWQRTWLLLIHPDTEARVAQVFSSYVFPPFVNSHYFCSELALNLFQHSFLYQLLYSQVLVSSVSSISLCRVISIYYFYVKNPLALFWHTFNALLFWRAVLQGPSTPIHPHAPRSEDLY